MAGTNLPWWGKQESYEVVSYQNGAIIGDCTVRFVPGAEDSSVLTVGQWEYAIVHHEDHKQLLFVFRDGEKWDPDEYLRIFGGE